MKSDDTLVRMPALGEATTEGTVARWLRRPGDRVASGEVIAEIVTDKVSEELLAPVDGILGPPLVASGSVSLVGTVLVTITPRAPDEPSLPPDGEGEAVPPATAFAGTDTPARTSPLVRRLADEHGIDLATVAGTGPGGRVTKDDVIAAMAPRAQDVGAVPPQPVPDEEVQSPSPLRQVIAANLVRAVQGVPQAWTLVEVDATALLAFRDAHREPVKARTGLTLGAFATFVHVAARVIAAHPLVNASWREGSGPPGAIGESGGRVVTRRSVHAGIAVARPGGGLLVPVIRNASGMTLDTLVRAMDTAVGGARNGALGAEWYVGATVTLNNTGALGSVVSQPILPAGTSAIIAFEAIVNRPVVVAGHAIAIRPMVNVCLTFDHRVLDGLEACSFLQALKRSVEGLDASSDVE
jgi:2-oxoisovalerate dehydrogenase E2 component (dihydrolipoyl transacylase)